MSKLPVVSLLAIAFALPTLAQPEADARAAQQGAAMASAAADMSEGEIRKVDKTAGTITIKHGEIKNLGMPPMTMVFKAKSAALLDKIKAGDKVRFRAEQNAAGALIVTDVQPIEAKS
jgi:Cu(I)/Ag(I) efflux system periplasmic protein CusF